MERCRPLCPQLGSRDERAGTLLDSARRSHLSACDAVADRCRWAQVGSRYAYGRQERHDADNLTGCSARANPKIAATSHRPGTCQG